MMERILSIGLPEFKSQYDLTALDSSVKFDDYDLVIFDSLHYLRNVLPKNSDYLSAEATEKINSHMKRRSSEIWRFVENGGLVVYFPHSKLEYKGYLNNSLKTLSFGDLVFEKNLTPSVGQKLSITNKINEYIHTFLDALQGMLIHRVILPNYAEYEACLESKDQGQIVGSYKLHDSGGAIIILPTLSFSNEENIGIFMNAAKQLRSDIPSLKPKKSTSVIKPELVQKIDVSSKQHVLTKSDTSRKADPGTIRDVIVGELVPSLLGDQQLPAWHVDYLLPDQEIIAGSIISLQDEILNLQAMLDTKKHEFKELDAYKLLVTAEGKPLEKIVSTVLTKMGLSLHEGSSIGDLTASYKDLVLIIEVKGRATKGAIESDAASLEKRAAKHFEDTGKPAKAVLIVNGYNTSSLIDRSSDIFSQPLIKYSTQRDHCLMSGLQLLCLYSECVKNPERQSDYLEQIIKSVGVFPGYVGNSWKDVLTVLSEVDASATA